MPFSLRDIRKNPRRMHARVLQAMAQFEKNKTNKKQIKRRHASLTFFPFFAVRAAITQASEVNVTDKLCLIACFSARTVSSVSRLSALASGTAD